MRKLKVCTLGLVTMSMVVSTAIPTGKGWFGTNTSVYADTNITQNNMLMDTNANAYGINTLADANLQLPVANALADTNLQLPVANALADANPKLLTTETTEESNVRQGKCGDNVFYKFDEKTRILTISGKGDMWDDYGFTKTMNNVKSIVVESGVTSIGAYSFLDLNYVTGVTMADTVTTINEYAFPMVDGTVEIPSSVVKVKSFAFDNAQRYLVKCDVKGFETSAFGYSANSEIVLYGSAQDLGKALYSCIPDAITIAKENQKCKVSNGCLLSADGKQLYYALNTRKTVKIPESVEEISVAAFTDKKFDSIEIGKNVKKIGAFAFEGARVKKLNVLGKIGRIGIKAFSCTRIKNVEFANKVKLGVDAFDNSVQIKFNKFKSAQTTIENATLGTKYNIKFAKIIGADGYQIKVKKGKKAYQYTTSSNSYKKSAPKYLISEYRKAKEYNLQDNAYLKKVSGAAYVTVRPYKRVKKKIVYGRWSERIVLSYNK